MSSYIHHEMFSLGTDETEYRKIGADHVSVEKLGSQEVLSVAPET